MNPIVASLRQQTMEAAKGFADYNFRHYFVKHTEDFFKPFATEKSKEETDKFVVDATAYLKQMQRMSVVNNMYAEQAVYLDKDVPPAASKWTPPSSRNTVIY